MSRALFVGIEITDGKINELLLETIPALIESGHFHDAAFQAQKLVQLLNKRATLEKETINGRYED